MTVLNYLNLISAAVIFVFCCRRLNRRQFEVRNWELWAHSGLVGGAVTVFAYSLQYPVIWPQAVFNASVALYFALPALCRRHRCG